MKAAVLLLLPPLLGIAYVQYGRLQLRARYRQQGWAVAMSGRNSIKYKERVLETDHEIEFSRDIDSIGRILWVPSEERWNRELPSWAMNRRAEILQRIKSTGIGAAHRFEVR